MRRTLANIYSISVYRELRALTRAQSLGEGDVSRIQEHRLVRLLSHASQRVPFYRRLLSDCAITRPDGSVTLDNFQQLPFLTKDVIRRHGNELVANDIHRRRWYYNTSGGSTGEPVRLIQDASFRRWARATKLLYDQWTGYHPGMPKLLLWGSERDLFIGRETPIVQLKRWFKNELWLNAMRMSPEDMLRYCEFIVQWRPVQILAYPESIYELALFCNSRGLRVSGVRAIMTSGGTLHSDMRRVIERTFGAPVFNRYGSREVGDIACECSQHSGLHISPLTHYVEIVRSDGTPAGVGEVGEIVVTSLVNYSMPLIRYKIGDLGSWSPVSCSCGREWPTLERVVGRTKDQFRLPDGTTVRVPDSLLYFRDWVRRFQFVQEDYYHITLYIVPSVDPKEAMVYVRREQQRLESRVRQLLDHRCKLDIKLVEGIPPSPSGKHRYVISKVLH